jgi:hypothetical protein
LRHIPDSQVHRVQRHPSLSQKSLVLLGATASADAQENWFHKRYLFLSLRTADPIHDRRLVVLLDGKLEEIVTAFEQSHLTPPQVDGLLRDVVTTHPHKLERLAAAAKSFSEFDAALAERDDRRVAWSCRLLHAQGPSPVVSRASMCVRCDTWKRSMCVPICWVIGKSETSERYREATGIATTAKFVRKMPIMTAHLVAHPINLPAWVTGKFTPPFSHPGRAKKRRAK